jgi:predicted nucleic-acid-binding protein
VIALDTNILIRLLTKDDPDQTALAEGPDCLIGAKARARGARTTTYTFERVLAQEQGFTRLV